MKKTIYFLIVFMALSFCVKSQDVHFSQYHESPMLLNPAMTGYFEGNHRLSAGYKNQWRSLGKAFNTYAFGYDLSFQKGQQQHGYLAVGLAAYNDVAGDLKLSTTNALFNIAYHLKVADNQSIAAGIYAGYSQRSFDQTAMQWGNQYDGTSGFDPTLPSYETFDKTSFGFADFGFGLNWHFMNNSRNMSSNDGFKMNAGISLNHVNQPTFQFFTSEEDRLKMKVNAHSKAQIGIPNSNMSVIPSVLVMIQGKQKEILPGIAARYTLREESRYTGFVKEAYFTLGGMVRTGDAVILHSMIEFNDFAFGLSYDVNISKLSNATSGKGGVEFAIRYIIKNPSNNKSFF